MDTLADTSACEMRSEEKNRPTYQHIWIPGPEDIVIDHAGGTACVSSQVRVPGSDTSTQQGAIYTLDLRSANPHPVNVTIDLPACLRRPAGAFHPHGISWWAGEDGRCRLFVINHPEKDRSTIELFDVDDGQLRHVRTLSNDLLTSPNDLVAFGPDQFYVTNDHGFRTPLLKGVEDAFHLRLGSVICFDNGKWTCAAEHLSYPNGIAVHPSDPTRVFVASVWGKKLFEYVRDPANPGAALTFEREIRLPAAPDNLEWDEDDNLWAGCHPDLGAVISHSLGHRPYAPSAVLKIAGLLTSEPEITEIFRDDGTRLSACSVAALDQCEGRKRLLIGSFSDDHLVLCDMDGYGRLNKAATQGVSPG